MRIVRRQTQPSANVRAEHRSESSEWGSPPPLLAGLQRLFGPFDLDTACGNPAFAKAPWFYGPAQNGLLQPWFGHAFTNPPWAKDDGNANMAAWLAKARAERDAARIRQATMLLPCRPDTKWYRSHVHPGASIVLLIHGRLTFVRMVNGHARTQNAPFPAMVVIYDQEIRSAPLYGMIDRNGNVIG